MGAAEVLLFVHCVAFNLLQMVALSSEKFTVIGLDGPVLAPLGGNLELSCQVSPPKNAQHMEIRWFRDRYTQCVHLYRDGKDLHGEIISKYVERTELLKDDIGKGKVTLKIFNMTVDDNGPYHCIFKDGEFYEEHITEVKVTATSSDIQIFMHAPNTKGVMLECHSGGWFPLPDMEWRDSKGEVIPATSKSYSQDRNKLFNMAMSLFVQASSYQNVTCCFQNLLNHQEESITVFLSGKLFPWKSVWMYILSLIAFVLIAFLMTSFIQQHLISGKESYPWKKSVMVFMISMVSIIGDSLILHLNLRVPVSDPHFELNTFWLEDISVILFVLIVFKIKFFSFTCFILDGYASGYKTCSHKFKIISMLSQYLCSLVSFIIFTPMLLKWNKVSVSDPLYSLYKSWAKNLEIVICYLVVLFIITTTILARAYIRIIDCFQTLVVVGKMQSEISR